MRPVVLGRQQPGRQARGPPPGMAGGRGRERGGGQRGDRGPLQVDIWVKNVAKPKACTIKAGQLPLLREQVEVYRVGSRQARGPCPPPPLLGWQGARGREGRGGQRGDRGATGPWQCKLTQLGHECSKAQGLHRQSWTAVQYCQQPKRAGPHLKP